MQDKPLFELENEYEIAMISEVLTDLAIPFRIERPSDIWGGRVVGEAIFKDSPLSYSYAKLYGYEKDETRMGELLNEVRTAPFFDDQDIDDHSK